jgi:transposase
MKVTTVGVDTAKNVFQVHGVDEQGHRQFARQLKVSQVIEFFTRLAPCVVAMEACGSSHYWARRLSALGHEVKLIAPQFVKPYVKTNKNDAADAAAICTAARQPDMRFVAPKSVEQQAVMALHALRSGAMKARNALACRLRGLLLEFGIAIAKGIGHVRKRIPEIVEDAGNDLPGFLRVALQAEYDQMKLLDSHAASLEQQIQQWHRQCAASQAIERISGVGVLSATAYVASMGDAGAFASGRHASSWVGIVPKQNSTGGKTRLLGISKRGDKYLRTLLIHGARSVISSLKRRLQSGKDPASFNKRERWVLDVMQRRNPNVAAVALANKNVRTAWAMLAYGRAFEPDHVSISPRARMSMAG